MGNGLMGVMRRFGAGMLVLGVSRQAEEAENLGADSPGKEVRAELPGLYGSLPFSPGIWQRRPGFFPLFGFGDPGKQPYKTYLILSL